MLVAAFIVGIALFFEEHFSLYRFH
ncbi:hypothetical protein ACVXZZ_05055 [Staphylococcus aureus]